MGWLKWFIAVIAAMFLYFGASQLFTGIVVGTTVTDTFVREVVPLIAGLVGLAVPLMIFSGR